MGNICSLSVSCDAILSRCLDCTIKKASYVHELEDNLEKLLIAVEKLIEARDDVNTRVIIAERREMKPLTRVQGWLVRVEAVETEVSKLLRDGPQQIEKLCLGGYCSNTCRATYKFEKKVVKALQDVDTLSGEGGFEVVAERVTEVAVDQRPVDPAVGLESKFDQVLSWLGEEDVGIIGLYGMGGVGKTTLLSQINNFFYDTPNDYDVVIWVVVSKNLQLEKIQEDIGKKIGFSHESWRNKSLEEKALDIFRILSKKKHVLLLDDVWRRVDLTKVGIPNPDPMNSSKIIFTTRLVEVCGHMEAQKKLRVECLQHEVACKLFQTKVGKETLDSHPDIPELAKIVTKECAGLPLALITIGRAMACKKTPEEWRYAVQILSRAASEFPGIDEVYPRLKFSYDCLPHNKIRSCFLYCSLFPEDYRINKNHLIDCWVGEEFFDGYNNDEVRNHGYYIIGVLLNACLLEDVDNNCVKMHDVIRDMTLWIACEVEKKENNFMVHAGVGLTETPSIRKFEGVRRMSLMNNRIKTLPITPTCPLLVTLFLNHNNLETISNGFFHSLPSLRVLNLSNNWSLTKLPIGISRLVSLRYLDLSHTGITELPNEMKALVNLTCLNLEHTSDLCIIPQKLISRFSKLQVLRMSNCGPPDAPFDNFLVKELLHLKHLKKLDIDLRSPPALQTFFSNAKLVLYTQSLSLQHFKYANMNKVLYSADFRFLEKLRILDWEPSEDFNLDLECIFRVPKPPGFQRLGVVNIQCCLSLREITWLLLAPNVKKLEISYCPGMKELISAGKLREVRDMMGYRNPFEKLEILALQNLENLKSIYWDPLPFEHLKEIRVNGCPKLKKLPIDLRKVQGSKIVIKSKQYQWWENLQWEEDQTTQSSFRLHFVHG